METAEYVAALRFSVGIDGKVSNLKEGLSILAALEIGETSF